VLLSPGALPLDGKVLTSSRWTITVHLPSYMAIYGCGTVTTAWEVYRHRRRRYEFTRL